MPNRVFNKENGSELMSKKLSNLIDNLKNTGENGGLVLMSNHNNILLFLFSGFW